jgi:hypothetical protein
LHPFEDVHLLDSGREDVVAYAREQFFVCFGLEDLRDLPDLEQLVNAVLVASS